ncbi:putative terminase small subunit [Pseudomonas phage AAT-1]|uniref:Terminase small subunit n=1 Tax=Pseudomonas phage AAT-1 TaxID=1775248 RepID=A0A193DRU2_9CAUD|nr:putative terminase small subunit [Pseudomonas phage AAT-1]ANN44565.1 putative terminase small subunit [Pseudomonas phage AAT-1]
MTVTAGGAWLRGRRFPSEGRPVADSGRPWPTPADRGRARAPHKQLVCVQNPSPVSPGGFVREGTRGGLTIAAGLLLRSGAAPSRGFRPT